MTMVNYDDLPGIEGAPESHPYSVWRQRYGARRQHIYDRARHAYAECSMNEIPLLASAYAGAPYWPGGAWQDGYPGHQRGDYEIRTSIDDDGNLWCYSADGLTPRVFLLAPAVRRRIPVPPDRASNPAYEIPRRVAML